MIKNIPGADLDFADAFHGGGNHSHNCNFHCHKEMNQHLLIHPSRSQMQTLSNLDSLMSQHHLTHPNQSQVQTPSSLIPLLIETFYGGTFLH
ncbi:uncharacterized protein LOC103880626 isoform X10 [Papio anubis]|uniref:uncharacterized protein LOC103880626 isoform X10 n=1 Tax=Papio anubis TaxID=9555 RepID=UPI0012AD7FEE|nr:uncharacterized protein LOC103880626 isoform X10 [Papio anubis]